MTTLTVPDPQALADGRADEVLPLYVAGHWEAAADGATYESYDRVWNWLMPFGGYKDSGYGREGGLEVMQHYTQTKSVWVDLQEEPTDWFGDA